MNYKIIKDEESLKGFIEWLPELGDDLSYYVSLLARNKYLEDKSILKTDKCSLKRFTANSKKISSTKN
jgi:hypothetical protein